MKTKKKTCFTALFLAAWAMALPSPSAFILSEKKAMHEAAQAKDDPLEIAKKELKAAKANRDDAGISHAYKTIMHLSPASEKTAYADSLVGAARRTKKDIEIGSAYITKGALYYSRRELEKALDCFLAADPYISKTGDAYLRYKHKYSVAVGKHELGYYDDAVGAFIECARYFEQENDQAYLNSLHLLSLGYLRQGQYALSRDTAERGLSASKSLKIPEMGHYFRQVLGANMFHAKNYGGAVAVLESELSYFKGKDDYANESATNYYIGCSKWEMGDKDGAIASLKEVERIFSSKKFMRPEFMNSYSIILDFYVAKGDSKNISKYASSLDSADAAINREFKYLASTVYKKYDVLRRKELIQKNDDYVRYLNKSIPIILVGFSILALALVQAYRRRRYDRSFRKIMEKLQQPKPEKAIDPKEDYPSKDKENDILSKIDKAIEEWEIFKEWYSKEEFMKKTGIENEKAFLQVLKRRKGMHYILFFHTQSIMHLLSKLMNDPSLFEKSYNQDLAELSNYSSGRALSDGMYMVLGMRPKQFIPRFRKYLSQPDSDSRSVQEAIEEIRQGLTGDADAAGTD